jgi:hypothetical protein
MLEGLLGEAGAYFAGEQEAVRALVANRHAKNIFQARKLPAFRSRCHSRTFDPSSKVRAVTQGRSL